MDAGAGIAFLAFIGIVFLLFPRHTPSPSPKEKPPDRYVPLSPNQQHNQMQMPGGYPPIIPGHGYPQVPPIMSFSGPNNTELVRYGDQLYMKLPPPTKDKP
jgi:hypothetical protein